MEDRGKFFNPAVTADVIVIKNHHGKSGVDGIRREVLLIQRREEPCKGMWAFPGGHMESTDQCIEEAALRELKEETGIAARFLRPVGVLSNQDRMDNPCICHVFCYSFWVDGKTGIGDVKAKAGDDADNATWFTVNTKFDRKANALSVRLHSEKEGDISFTAHFTMSPFGFAETVVDWDGNTEEKMAFDHANMLAKALCRFTEFLNIGVSD